MDFLKPYLGLIKVAVIIGAAVIVFNLGADRVQAEWDREKLNQANAIVDLERETRRAVDTITEKSKKEREHAKATIENLRADLRDRAVRLSVPVESCAAADSSLGHRETRADILPASADRIVGIIGEADDTVRELNECIDKYNAVRSAHGGR